MPAFPLSSGAATDVSGAFDAVIVSEKRAIAVIVRCTGTGTPTADFSVEAYVDGDGRTPGTDAGTVVAAVTGVGSDGKLISISDVPLSAVRVSWSNNTGTVVAAYNVVDEPYD